MEKEMKLYDITGKSAASGVITAQVYGEGDANKKVKELREAGYRFIKVAKATRKRGSGQCESNL